MASANPGEDEGGFALLSSKFKVKPGDKKGKGGNTDGEAAALREQKKLEMEDVLINY